MKGKKGLYCIIDKDILDILAYKDGRIIYGYGFIKAYKAECVWLSHMILLEESDIE